MADNKISKKMKLWNVSLLAKRRQISVISKLWIVFVDSYKIEIAQYL